MVPIAYYLIFYKFFKTIFIYFYKKNIISLDLIEIFLKFKNIIKGGSRLSKRLNHLYSINYIINYVKRYLYFILKNIKILEYPRGVLPFF